jgi:hypothetical protein
MVACHAVGGDVINGTFSAGEAKAFGDLGRDATAWARYQGFHVSHL